MTPAYEYQRSRSDDESESSDDDLEADGCFGCVPRPRPPGAAAAVGRRSDDDDFGNDFDALVAVDPDKGTGRDEGEGVNRFLECLFGVRFLNRGASRAVIAADPVPLSSNGDPSSSSSRPRRPPPRAVGNGEEEEEEVEAVGNDYFLAPIREASGPDSDAAPPSSRSLASPPPHPHLSERTATDDLSFQSALSERTAEDDGGGGNGAAEVRGGGGGVAIESGRGIVDEDASASDAAGKKKKKKKGKALRAIRKTILRTGSRGMRRKGRKEQGGEAPSGHRRADSACEESVDSDAATTKNEEEEDGSSTTGSLSSPSPRRKPPGVVAVARDFADGTDGATTGVRAEIDKQLGLLERAETKLRSHKSALSDADRDAASIVRTTSEIAARVDQLRTAAANLEIVLDRSRKALEHERKLLVEERAKMDELESARRDVASDVANVEREVAERKSYVESLRDRAENGVVLPPTTEGRAIAPAEMTAEGAAAGLDGSSLHEHPIVPVKEETEAAGNTGLVVVGGGGGGKNESRTATGGRGEEEEERETTTTRVVDGEAKLPPPPPATKLRRSSSSFIRVHDLQLTDHSRDASADGGGSDGGGSDGAASSSDDADARSAPPQAKGAGNEDGFSILDDELRSILSALNDVGYRAITDEGERWVPTRDTEKILAKRKGKGASTTGSADERPEEDTKLWHCARGKDVLVWSGTVEHGGYGSDLPVVKARGIVRTSARDLLDLLLDSSRVKDYNKLSLGRDDDFVYQRGVDTSKDESPYGLDGEIKILRSRNKPPVVRRNIEMLTIIHARALDEAQGEGRGYMAVSRSIWESPDAAKRGTSNADKNVVRSEMVLGVNYIRELPGREGTECELTTLTHVYSPLVPRGFAKKFAPTAATSFVRDLQSLWE